MIKLILFIYLLLGIQDLYGWLKTDKAKIVLNEVSTLAAIIFAFYAILAGPIQIAISIIKYAYIFLKKGKFE